MDVSDNNVAVLTEYNDSTSLLVIFGGIKQGVGMPIFEFKNVLKEVSSDKIFLRDFNQAWYHNGLNKEINNIESLKSYLNKTIVSKKYEKVVFLGNSMGGYAAILFGTLLAVNHIIAFSPQTFIDKFKRFIYKDKRWFKQISNLHSSTRNPKQYYDLKSFLKNKKYRHIPISLYYSKNHNLDKLHCERLEIFNSVNLYSYEFDSHNLVRELRDTKQLVEIINSCIR